MWGRVVSALFITVPITVATLGLDFGLIGYGVGKAAISKQSRNYELQADALGLKLMMNAGYDPKAMETVQLKILGDGSNLVIWRSHPTGTVRLAAIRKLTQAYLAEAQQKGQKIQANSPPLSSSTSPNSVEKQTKPDEQGPDYKIEMEDVFDAEPNSKDMP
jgi:predicted Zn-dependent protease